MAEARKFARSCRIGVVRKKACRWRRAGMIVR
jgi:hypothetical protein